jgi:hypothetical protein
VGKDAAMERTRDVLADAAAEAAEHANGGA